MIILLDMNEMMERMSPRDLLKRIDLLIKHWLINEWLLKETCTRELI